MHTRKMIFDTLPWTYKVDNVEINFDAMKKKVFMALPLYLISKSSYIFEKCCIVAFGKSIQSFVATAI